MGQVVFQQSSTPTLDINIVDENGGVVDFSGATRKRVVIVRPNGEEFEKTIAYVTDGSDGRGRVVFTRAEIKIPGTYRGQPDLAYGDWDGPLPEFQFTVNQNLSRTLS